MEVLRTKVKETMVMFPQYVYIYIPNLSKLTNKKYEESSTGGIMFQILYGSGYIEIFKAGKEKGTF